MIACLTSPLEVSHEATSFSPLCRFRVAPRPKPCYHFCFCRCKAARATCCTAAAGASALRAKASRDRALAHPRVACWQNALHKWAGRRRPADRNSARARHASAGNGALSGPVGFRPWRPQVASSRLLDRRLLRDLRVLGLLCVLGVLCALGELCVLGALCVFGPLIFGGCLCVFGLHLLEQLVEELSLALAVHHDLRLLSVRVGVVRVVLSVLALSRSLFFLHREGAQDGLDLRVRVIQMLQQQGCSKPLGHVTAGLTATCLGQILERVGREASATIIGVAEMFALQLEAFQNRRAFLGSTDRFSSLFTTTHSSPPVSFQPPHTKQQQRLQS